MPKIVRARPRASDWWPALVMGAAVGVAMSWLMLRRDELGSDREDPALAEDLVTERRAARHERRRSQRGVDLGALVGRLRAQPGTDGLRVHPLGQGIVELIGNAADGIDVPAVIRALAQEPGVSVVVNRVWTPDSAARS